jgi:hypothetical protein
LYFLFSRENLCLSPIGGIRAFKRRIYFVSIYFSGDFKKELTLYKEQGFVLFKNCTFADSKNIYEIYR